MTERPDAEDAVRILGLLAEPERLEVFAAVALGHSTLRGIAVATGLEERVAGRALARLAAGELVVADGDGGYRVAVEDLKAFARAVAPSQDASIDAPPDSARVLRSFFRGNRLVRIPVQRSKRLVVLDHLVQAFEPGRRYPEKVVNAILRDLHDDVASLRRYLVDEGLMTREKGFYWRSGGTFEVD